MAEENPRHGDARPRPAGPVRHGSGADTGWSIIGTMISGMAVWGGAGWLLDRWLETRAFLPVGIILGMAAAIYVVVKRYGAVPPPSGGPSKSRTPGGRRNRPGGSAQTQKGQR
jgi:F0F1-type ATP synthase assembly protein I